MAFDYGGRPELARRKTVPGVGRGHGMMGGDVDVLNRYNSSIAWSDGSGVGPVRFAVKNCMGSWSIWSQTLKNGADSDNAPSSWCLFLFRFVLLPLLVGGSRGMRFDVFNVSFCFLLIHYW